MPNVIKYIQNYTKRSFNDEEEIYRYIERRPRKRRT